MGLRKEIIKLLDTPGLGVDEALCKIGDLVRAEKPKKEKVEFGTPFGRFEIRKELAGEGEKKYRIDSFSQEPLPASAIIALEKALKVYVRDIGYCDCAECEKAAEQLKTRGAV